MANKLTSGQTVGVGIVIGAVLGISGGIYAATRPKIGDIKCIGPDLYRYEQLLGGRNWQLLEVNSDVCVLPF